MAAAALGRPAPVLLSALLPDECRLCDAPLRNLSRIPLCEACRAALVAYPFSFSEPDSPLDAVYACGVFEAPLRDAIHLFKYGRIPALAPELGKLLAGAAPTAACDVIVPMPMHWARRWRRGFNQADLLARDLSRRTGIPCRGAARRRRAAPAQAGLSRPARFENVAGVFAVPRPARIRGKRVLLVDDVFTTGATAQACAAALKKAGAAEVILLALARAGDFADSARAPEPAGFTAPPPGSWDHA